MQQHGSNYLSANTPLTQGVGSKGRHSVFFFQKVSMLHIQLKGIEHKIP